MALSALADRRMVVTRPAAQAELLCQMLGCAGAIPIRFPTIRLVRAPEWRPVQAALSRLEEYDWVVFTSVNGVRYALEFMDGPWQAVTKVAAIGPATRKALESRDVSVQYMPEEYRAEAVADGIDGKRVLLLHARGARPALRTLLQARGVRVEEVAVYYAETNRPSPAAFDAVQAGVDAVTFTSASTARSYAELQGTDTQGAVVACIGPVTANAASALGFNVRAVATEYTTQGLVDALKEYYAHE